MDDAAKSPEAEDPEALALALAQTIDAMMAGPIKTRPAVIVLGDDAVTGFTPIEAARDCDGG